MVRLTNVLSRVEGLFKSPNCTHNHVERGHLAEEHLLAHGRVITLPCGRRTESKFFSYAPSARLSRINNPLLLTFRAEYFMLFVSREDGGME